MRNLTRAKLIVYLAAIFLAGAVGGTFLGLRIGRQMNSHPPRNMARHFRDTLQTQLKLSEAQLQQIDPLLQKRSDEMKAIHRASMKQIGETLQKSDEEIAQFLSPEQKLKLEAMEQERREFFKKNSRERPPSPKP